MKFGDLVANSHTKQDNPYHVLMVIRDSFGWIDCIAIDGRALKFSSTDNKKDNFLFPVGHLDMTPWENYISDVQIYTEEEPRP